MTLVLAFFMGCSKENEVDADPTGDGGSGVPGAIGSQCSGTDDPACGVASVCVLGYCRSGCTTDVECPQGTICIGETPPYGCQLPQDLACNDTDKTCVEPLVCGLDKTCRMPCQVSKDCPRNEHVCIAGACVGESEKGEGAVAMLSCPTGDRRCGDVDGPCGGGVCVVQGCNENAPGWAEVETCSGEKAFCEAGTCVGIAPQDPGQMVQVPDPNGGTYGIDATEVTRAQYAKFVLEKESDTSGQLLECLWNDTFVPAGDWPPSDRPNHPVAFVDWCDAYAYCKWAGKRLCGNIGGGPGKSGEEADASKRQWYRACSSGGANLFPYGDVWDSDTCNHFGNGDVSVEVASLPSCTSPVGAYAGLFDLSGNVREWEDGCTSQVGPKDRCPLRGGAFDFGSNEDYQCRSTVTGGFRSGDPDTPGTRAGVGFRCCSDP